MPPEAETLVSWEAVTVAAELPTIAPPAFNATDEAPAFIGALMLILPADVETEILPPATLFSPIMDFVLSKSTVVLAIFRAPLLANSIFPALVSIARLLTALGVVRLTVSPAITPRLAAEIAAVCVTPAPEKRPTRRS